MIDMPVPRVPLGWRVRRAIGLFLLWLIRPAEEWRAAQRGAWLHFPAQAQTRERAAAARRFWAEVAVGRRDP